MQRIMGTGPAGSWRWLYRCTDAVLTRLCEDKTIAGQVKWAMLLKVKKEKEERKEARRGDTQGENPKGDVGRGVFA